jgi:DNA-binding Xre family transcriptional regulator
MLYAQRPKIAVKSHRVLELVARRNETVEDLARAIGMHPRHLQRVLGGLGSPQPSTRRKLCKALGCRFDDIFEIVSGSES